MPPSNCRHSHLNAAPGGELKLINTMVSYMYQGSTVCTIDTRKFGHT